MSIQMLLSSGRKEEGYIPRIFFNMLVCPPLPSPTLKGFWVSWSGIGTGCVNQKTSAPIFCVVDKGECMSAAKGRRKQRAQALQLDELDLNHILIDHISVFQYKKYEYFAWKNCYNCLRLFRHECNPCFLGKNSDDSNWVSRKRIYLGLS